MQWGKKESTSKQAPTMAPFCPNPPVTSLRCCSASHHSLVEIDKAFSQCVILPPGVREHFPKVTFAPVHTLGGYLPPSAQLRSVGMWRAGDLVWLGSSSVSVFTMGFPASLLLTLLCLLSPCTGRKRTLTCFSWCCSDSNTELRSRTYENEHKQFKIRVRKSDSK